MPATLDMHKGVITLRGELTLTTVKELWENSRSFFDGQKTPLKIDLTQITQSDSAGVALLIAWVRLAHQQKREIFLISLPKQMQAIIRVSGLENLLPVVVSPSQNREQLADLQI